MQAPASRYESGSLSGRTTTQNFSLEDQSFLLKEVAPLSHNLSALAASGLEAMDYLDRGEHPSDAWKTQQLALVKQAQEQKAQLLIMVAPSIQKLIDSSTGQAVAAPGHRF